MNKKKASLSGSKRGSEQRASEKPVADYKLFFNRELIFGICFIIVGFLVLFNEVLNIEIGFTDILSIIFFIAGIWFHIKFFQIKDIFKNLLIGHILLFLSLSLSVSIFSFSLNNIFSLFILFQVAAVSILAYTIRKDIPWLLVIAAATFILIAIFLLSYATATRINTTAFIWVIAFIFLYLHYEKPVKSNIYLLLSGFFLLIGLAQSAGGKEGIFSTLILWFLAAAFLFLYVQKPQHWWALLIGGVLAMSGAQTFNDEVIRLIPLRLEGTFWLLGLGLVFMLIWILGKSEKEPRWAMWIGIILCAIGLFVGIVQYFHKAEDLIIPIALIISGAWIIFAKVIRAGKNLDRV